MKTSRDKTTNKFCKLAQHRVADKRLYLEHVLDELIKEWPKNRTINIVFHGHSVPAGYFVTPVVETFNSYPHLFHKALKKKYPYAVVNVIVTAIGGENSVNGAKRFEKDVVPHSPDVVLIDYALNDLPQGLDAAEKAWSQMIEISKEKGIKVILLTPTLHSKHLPGNPADPLNRHAEQIRNLAAKYNVGLVDSFDALNTELKTGKKVTDFLSNGHNHPNRKAHKIVAQKIMQWF